MKHYSKLITTCLLVLSASIAWINTLNNGYVYDDVSVIQKNRYIRDLRNITDIFSKRTYFARSGIAKYRRYGEGSYRPIVTLSYFLDYQLIGNSAKGSHCINLIYHIIYLLLLYKLLLLLSGNRLVSFLSTLIFSVHPVNSEAINAIAFREDILCSIFVCMCLTYYHHYIKGLKKNLSHLIISLICYFLACLSKENGSIALPIIFVANVLIYTRHVYRTRIEKVLSYKKSIKRFLYIYILYGVVFAIYAFIRFYLFNYHEGIIPPNLTITEIITRLIRFFNSILYYSRLILVPNRLLPAYNRTFLHSPLLLLLSIPFLVLLIWLIYIYRTKKPLISFWLLWFLITLLPVSGLIFLQHPTAERYLYLPCIGIIFVCIYSIERYISRQSIQRIYLLGFIYIFSNFTIWSIQQNTVWATEFSLWNYTAKYAEDNYNTCANYAVVLSESGNIQEAIIYYKKALAIDNRAQSHYNLANAYNHLGLKAQAEASLRTSIKLDPNYSEAHTNLAQILGQQGKFHEAIEHLEKAIALNPYNPQAFNNLGGCFNSLKQFDKGIKSLQRAILLKPNYINAYFNIASAYYMKGDYLKAEQALRWIITKDPSNKRAYSFLESVLEQQKIALTSERTKQNTDTNPRPSKTNTTPISPTHVPHKEMSPNHRHIKMLTPHTSSVPSLSNLFANGDSLMKTGNYVQALKFYRKSIKEAPSDPSAYFRLAQCYIKLKSLDLAHTMLNKVIELEPTYPDAKNLLSTINKKLNQGK